MEVSLKTHNYVVAAYKSWNRRILEEVITAYPGSWHYINAPERLTAEELAKSRPRYVFFLHWPWKVPKEVLDNYECVCFHMTDVPYGRGRSPLQNLIARGHRKTKLTALRMVESFDAGPVYLEENLSLEGNAEEIYIRESQLSADMIRQIIETEPVPKDQVGESVIFKRRTPEESRIPQSATLPLFSELKMPMNRSKVLNPKRYIPSN